jgi:transcriptional regulator with XRE-family HTH domain
MLVKRRQRGFLATNEGVRLLEEQRFKLGLTMEEIAAKADLGSVDQVNRLFHPAWGINVERKTIDKIARALELNSADIISTENSTQMKPSSEQSSVVPQKLLCDIEVDENLEVGDIIQRAGKENSVEQVIATNVKAKNIKFGNVTQEG